MVPSLVAGTVGAGPGWANRAASAGDRLAGHNPSQSSANGKLTFYEPDVNSEIYKKYGPKAQ
jgi:hypothetical protein